MLQQEYMLGCDSIEQIRSELPLQMKQRAEGRNYFIKKNSPLETDLYSTSLKEFIQCIKSSKVLISIALNNIKKCKAAEGNRRFPQTLKNRKNTQCHRVNCMLLFLSISVGLKK